MREMRVTARRVGKIAKLLRNIDIRVATSHEMPPEQHEGLRRFRIILNRSEVCVLCKSTFNASQTGAQLCAFHPSKFVGTGHRIIGDYSKEPPPSTCTACNYASIATSSRSSALPLPTRADKMRPCARIDHCTSVEALLNSPFVALPAFYLNELAVAKIARIRFPRDSAIIALSKLTGAVLIAKPKDLLRTLFVDIPHSPYPSQHSVQSVYEEMCEKFGLSSLERTVRLARNSNPAAAEKDAVAYAHPDAARRAQLFAHGQHKAAIVPMIIIPRVSQTTPGSRGVRVK